MFELLAIEPEITDSLGALPLAIKVKPAPPPPHPTHTHMGVHHLSNERWEIRIGRHMVALTRQKAPPSARGSRMLFAACEEHAADHCPPRMIRNPLESSNRPRGRSDARAEPEGHARVGQSVGG